MKLILLNSHSVAKRHLAALFVCAVVLAGTSNAQDAPPPGTTVLHVDSRLVVLDVVVTGKDGKPVPGLGKKDFTVLEDGQPQRIRSVDYTASPSDPASHSRTILVLDALNNSIEETSYAKSELEHYVATLPEILLQPAMLIAIDDDGLHVLIASTRNRDAVQHALHQDSAKIPSAFLRHDYEARFRITLNALWQIASANQGSADRIEMIWVGHGFPSMNLTTLDGSLATALQATVQNVTNSLLNARTVVYKIDPAAVGAGQMTPGLDNFDASVDDSVAPFEDTIGFDTLVQQTGGRTFYNRNDIDTEVHNAVTLGGTFYTIAYVPGSTSTEAAAYRHIRVTVDNPALHATTRLGYYTGVAAASSQPDPDKTVDAAILNQLHYTALDIGIAGCTPAANGTTLCKLQIDPNGLHWNDAPGGNQTASLLVSAAAYSATQKPLNYTRRSITLQSAANRAKDAKLSFDVPMHIPPEARSLRFIVLDTASRKLGSAESATIPNATTNSH